MTLSDYLTLGLSILAFGFSIITFVYNTYEQYLKAAKLRLVMGRELKFGYLDGTQRLGFWVPAVLTNQGAVDAVVLSITGSLTFPDGTTKADVEWYTVGDYDGTKDQFTPKGWTDSLIVPSRKATTNWIGLRAERDVPVSTPGGSYTLTLHVEAPVGARRGARSATTWTGTLDLGPNKMLEGSVRVVELSGTAQNVTALVPGLKALLGRTEIPGLTDQRVS